MQAYDQRRRAKLAVVTPLSECGLVEGPSHHILSPAFFTEEPEECHEESES
jgi:hypothetical protein